MKKLVEILIITLIIAFCACVNEDNEQVQNTVEIASESTYKVTSLLERLIKRQERLEEKQKQIERNKEGEAAYKVDSIRMNQVLEEALEKAILFTSKDAYNDEYILLEEDSTTIKVKIQIGQFFDNFSKNLVIYREGKNDVFINVYNIKQQKIKEILAHQEWSLPYVSDTIQDINGDRRSDLVINGYGVNGCCLKAYSIVYLSRPNNGGFSDGFHFINPTFSSTEGVIRGICYGHLGETEMYKYKWNGERIDTVEYVYFQKNEKGEKTDKIVLSNRRPFNFEKKRKEKIVEVVPTEYKSIYGFDWFMGNVN